MHNWVDYIGIFVAGIIIGLCYHGALWWTVRSLPRARSPVLVSVASFYLRMALVMAAFYVVMQDDWRRIAFCMAGFILIRLVIVRTTGKKAPPVTGIRRN